MEIFDYTGPNFLTFYITTLIGVVVVALALARVLRTPSDVPPNLDAQLDPFDIAFLTGGRRRVVDAALVSLFQRDLLKPPSLTALEPNPRPQSERLHPVESFIWDRIRSGGASIKVLHQLQLPSDLVEDRLRQQELLLPPERAVVIGSLKVLPLIGLLAAGVIKIFIGLNRDRPVGFLVALCILTVIALIALGRRYPRLTLRGQNVINTLRKQNSALQYSSRLRPEDLVWRDVALATAIFGVGALVHGPMAAIAQPLNRDRTGLDAAASGGGDGGGGCGGHAGCGGGDGGGGGCGGGGCGGCGGGD